MIISHDSRYTVESISGNEIISQWKVLDHVNCEEHFISMPRSMDLSEIEAADFYFDDAYLMFVK